MTVTDFIATRVKVGDPAPDFRLPAQDGRVVGLSDFRGERSVVLYFYPRDNTPACTMQSCAFRDEYTLLREEGAEVIGVSADPPDSHATFADRHGLPFMLVSDPEGNLRRLYGLRNTLGVLPRRVTFVIDRDGIVRLVYSSQLRPRMHARRALEVLRRLNVSS